MNTERKSLSGPPELFEMKRAFQIEFLKSVGLEPRHFLLDIGCGNLRGGIPIIDYLLAGHYIGIDSRAEAMTAAMIEVEKAGLRNKVPSLHHFSEQPLRRFGYGFEFIWAFSVLIHMDDLTLFHTLSFVAQHLLGDGVFYANVNIGMKAESTWQDFPVVWRPLKLYSTLFTCHGLALTDLGPLKDHGHNSGDEAGDSQRMLKAELI